MVWRKWVGIGMILMSGVWFAGILIVPFTVLSITLKAALGLLFLAMMEVFFWTGSIIVGKQALSHLWSSIKKRRTGAPATPR